MSTITLEKNTIEPNAVIAPSVANGGVTLGRTLYDTPPVRGVVRPSAWDYIIDEFRDRGARILPGPWARQGGTPDNGDRSVTVEYDDPGYGTFLMQFIDRDDHMFSGEWKRWVSFNAWLHGDGRESNERGLTGNKGRMFAYTDDDPVTILSHVDTLIEELRTIADTDAWTGKRVGWRNMRIVGFANYASDESYEQARSEIEYAGWCN